MKQFTIQTARSMVVSSTPRRLLALMLVVGMSVLLGLLTSGCAQNRVAFGQEKPLPAAGAVDVTPTLTPAQQATARQLLINNGCSACHTIGIFPEAAGVFGPNLTHIGPDAAKVVLSPAYLESAGTATTGRDYLRESILEPARYIATDCPDGPCPLNLMPLSFRQQLSPADLDLIVDLLASLQ